MFARLRRTGRARHDAVGDSNSIYPASTAASSSEPGSGKGLLYYFMEAGTMSPFRPQSFWPRTFAAGTTGSGVEMPNVEIRLEQQQQMEFEDTMQGSIVISLIGPDAPLSLRKLPIGSQLIAVDGEALTSDNHSRLLSRVAQWSLPVLGDFPDGGRKFLQPIAPDERCTQTDGQARAGGLACIPIEAVAPGQILHLTFRAQTARSDLESQEIYPVGVQLMPEQDAEDANFEQEEARMHLVADLRQKLGDGDLVTRTAMHFLVTSDWSVGRAKEQYQATLEEVKELRASVHAAGEETADQAESGLCEQIPALSTSNVEVTSTEEFPLFQNEEQGQAPTEAITPDKSMPEYDVSITEQDKLGVTVENILERTIVAHVTPSSCAYRAGVEEGCLIVSLADLSTCNMCHKGQLSVLLGLTGPQMTRCPDCLASEVLERLQTMHRPLRMRLRRLSQEKLQQRRAEMVALVHPNGSAQADDESRGSVIAWALRRLLCILRLLAIEPSVRGTLAGNEEETNPVLDSWRDSLLDVAEALHRDGRRSRLRQTGLRDRLRLIAFHLQRLESIFSESKYQSSTLFPSLRFDLIDLLCQMMSLDTECAMTTTRGLSELSQGPAITLLTKITPSLPPSHLHHSLNPLLYRLAGSPSMHARLACCALCPVIYHHLAAPHQLQVRGILMRFLTEDVIVMRTAIVDTLARFADSLEYNSIRWLLTMLEAAARDVSLSLRNKVLEICYHTAASLQRASLAYAGDTCVLQELHLHRCRLLPFVNGSADDSDWQVRAAFAFFCPGFVEFFGEHWAMVFLDNLDSLLRDSEVPVRRHAVESLVRIAISWLQQGRREGAVGKARTRALEVLIPSFGRLVSDPAAEVRAGVAGATGRLLRILTEDGRADEKVVQVITPLMQRILHDEAPAEVSFALLASMRIEERYLIEGRSMAAAGMSILVDLQVELLLPALIFLTTNPSWRLRISIVECLPALQAVVGRGHRFESVMEDLWNALMEDGVEIVRRRAGEYLVLTGLWLDRRKEEGDHPPGDHTADLGIQQAPEGPTGRAEEVIEQGDQPRPSWLTDKVTAVCRTCLLSPAFKQRQLGLHVAESIILHKCLPAEDLESELLPLLIAATQDRLANVRIVAGTIWQTAGSSLPTYLRTRSSPLVVQLYLLKAEDPDRDVRFSAGQALKILSFEPPASSRAEAVPSMMMPLSTTQKGGVAEGAPAADAVEGNTGMSGAFALPTPTEGLKGALPPAAPLLGRSRSTRDSRHDPLGISSAALAEYH